MHVFGENSHSLQGALQYWQVQELISPYLPEPQFDVQVLTLKNKGKIQLRQSVLVPPQQVKHVSSHNL